MNPESVEAVSELVPINTSANPTENPMTANELKTLLQTAPKSILSTEYSLFQRSLAAEMSPWIREVESTAKRLKTGKVVLVAVLVD